MGRPPSFNFQDVCSNPEDLVTRIRMSDSRQASIELVSKDGVALHVVVLSWYSLRYVSA